MNRIAPAVLAGVAAIAVCAVLVTARQPAGEGSGPAFVEPERSAPAPAAVPNPPEVPEAADRLPPVSFTLVTTFQDGSGRRRTVEQQVFRGVDHVSLIVDGGRREWFFERNPVHRNRVSGWLVDHEAKQIRAYQESDLRTALRLNGWLDVLTMRVDLAAMNALGETGETRVAGDATFHHRRSAAPAPSGVVDAWWSPELLLALELVTRESETLETTARVTGLSRTVDPAALTTPQSRYPSYRVLDEADAGEHR